MVVIRPSAIPKPSLSSTCTTGARQFVVQEALDTMMIRAVVEMVVHAHHHGEILFLAGAEIITFFAPASMALPFRHR